MDNVKIISFLLLAFSLTVGSILIISLISVQPYAYYTIQTPEGNQIVKAVDRWEPGDSVTIHQRGTNIHITKPTAEVDTIYLVGEYEVIRKAIGGKIIYKIK